MVADLLLQRRQLEFLYCDHSPDGLLLGLGYSELRASLREDVDHLSKFIQSVDAFLVLSLDAVDGLSAWLRCGEASGGGGGGGDGGGGLSGDNGGSGVADGVGSAHGGGVYGGDGCGGFGGDGGSSGFARGIGSAHGGRGCGGDVGGGFSGDGGI